MIFRVQDSLSRTTSNRYDQYLCLPNIIDDTGIFFGRGFGNSNYYFGLLEFHNTIVRSFIDFGLFHCLAIIMFTIFPLIKRVFQIKNREKFGLEHVVLLAGIMIMMVEPRMIWGGLLSGLVWIYFWKLCLVKERT